MKTTAMNMMWLPGNVGIDTYGAFRGVFELPTDIELEIRVFGSHFFNVWIDGMFLCEGPARFESAHPEYDVLYRTLKAGKHLLAAMVHNEGVSNRRLRSDILPPFFACRILQNNNEVAVLWSCMKLEGFASQVRRISPCLGWIEWCDTSKNPVDWHMPNFQSYDWQKPAVVTADLGILQPLRIGPIKRFLHKLTPITEGHLADVFGYERDDISAQFYLRNLTCDNLPPQGVWRRYDLGRVRLGKPCFTLDVPAGTIIEFAYSEILCYGRVLPWIPLSLGLTCNLDHYVARGGLQTFCPLTPKAGRFVEIHIKAEPAVVRFLDEQFIERCYFDAPQGSFECGDNHLNAIWFTGVETLCACAEDAIVDTPYRERGQWIGDSLTVGMEIASTVYSDLRLFERTLRQSVWAADKRGLAAGMCSGECIYLPAYALQWITASVRYYELTGRRDILAELYPYAIRMMSAFESVLDEKGLGDGLGENFIDWGYIREGNGPDMAYNLHYLCALRSMFRWAQFFDRSEAVTFMRIEKSILDIITRWINKKLADNQNNFTAVGYHVTTLALLMGIFEKHQENGAVEYIKHHLLNCFPNNLQAPRLADPMMRSPQIITPYFSHFVMPPLIERGHMDFVLELYRTCWGWFLDQGCTTWPEVFDLRWSHSHHWSGCPTWHLSRYVLGLHPRFDLGMQHYDFKFFSGSLNWANGTLPIPFSDAKIVVEWIRRPHGIEYTLRTDQSIFIHLATSLPECSDSLVEIHGERSFVIPESLLCQI